MGLAVRADGEVFAVGRVTGVVDFGLGNTAASSATDDAFVARFSPDGLLRWAKRFGDTGVNAFHGVAVTNDTVYVGGHYEGAPDFGNGPLPARGGSDAVVMRLAAEAGAFRWVSTFGGSDNQRIYGLTVDETTVVAAGYYWDAIDLPDVQPAQRSDGIVVGYDPLDGSFVDAHTYGGPNCDFLESARASEGQVIATGTFQDTITLDTSLTAIGLADSIVFGVTHLGFQWHRSFGDATDEIANTTAGALSSALYAGGTRNVQLDSGCYQIPGATTGYIRRF
jgi:hypothetical protein